MTTWPIVTCLCPTMTSRRQWLPRVTRMFIEQDYPGHLELLIGDDDVEAPPWGSQAIDGRKIRVITSTSTMDLGSKRNWMIGEADPRRDVFVHWDDDDYHGPSRVRKQVEAMFSARVDQCLLYPWLIYFKGTGVIQNTARAIGVDVPAEGLLREAQRDIVVGGSALFTRRFWMSQPFPTVAVGSDRIHHAHPRAIADVGMDYIVIRHQNNNSDPPGGMGGYFYEDAPYSIAEVEACLEDIQARCGVPTASM